MDYMKIQMNEEENNKNVHPWDRGAREDKPTVH